MLPLDQAGRLSVDGWADRVDRVADAGEDLDPPAVLLRTDGYVTRVGEDQQALGDAPAVWSGAASV